MFNSMNCPNRLAKTCKGDLTLHAASPKILWRLFPLQRSVAKNKYILEILSCGWGIWETDTLYVFLFWRGCWPYQLVIFQRFVHLTRCLRSRSLLTRKMIETFSPFFGSCFSFISEPATDQSCDPLLTEEILHQLIGNLFWYLQGFLHPKWCRMFVNQQFVIYLSISLGLRW